MKNFTAVVQLISQLRGYFYVNPILALSLAITIFSFVGVPPLVGFFAKQMVLSAALDSGYVFLSLVAILTSVVAAVYVRPLIIRTPGSLNLTFETLKSRYKPVNLSDFEMNRGVQHVEKSLTVSNIFAVFLYVLLYLMMVALVPLSHVKFNLPVNFGPVTIPMVLVPMISLKSRLSRYVVSFGRSETTSLRELAKRKITDVLVRTGDLLREVILKIDIESISSINVEGRRSFRSINLNNYNWEGKQNHINTFSSLASGVYIFNLKNLHYLREVSIFKARLVLNVTNECVVKHTHTLGKIRLISSSAATRGALDPWFITGFTDAEGSFGANFRRSTALALGMRFQPVMAIQLHKKDIDLLNEIRGYFGNVGFITEGENLASFRVQSLKEISANIIPHFDKYPLITQKQADYLLFREIVMKMIRKEHLSKEGIQSIVNIKASLNLGLSEDLKVTFPETKPVARPVVSDQKISNPGWIAGFTSGDGSFSVSVYNTPARKLGVRVLIRFMITQHLRDELLMKSLVEYLDCGSYTSRGTREWGEFVVYNISDITEKIIPFFQKYKIRGRKFEDFQDWCQIVELMKDDKGLSQKKLDQIIKIKSSMNKGRK